MSVKHMITYGKQTIDQVDIQAITDVLEANKYLTTGPKVDEFEQKLCEYTKMKYAAVVSSGTAALHCAIYSANIGKDDEVIVTTMSFIATANCILYQNAIPIFADIDPNTMNIDPQDVINKITKNTKAIIAVDFAGQICNYPVLREICDEYNLILIEDAAHSLGMTDNKYADLITLSFHPIKNITTGEGGAVLTNNIMYINRVKTFRNHGIDVDYKNRKLHYYSMEQLGYNYRLSDIHCALGISQLNRLDEWIKIRNQIANKYTDNFKKLSNYLIPLTKENNCAYHIYVIKLNLENLNATRDDIYKEFIARNIGVNVHYKPIHMQPFFINKYKSVNCPNAEIMYNCILTLPIYPTLSDELIEYIIETTINIMEKFKK